MSLRRRLVLLASGTVAVTVVLASVLCYLAMRAELRSEVDEAMIEQAQVAGWVNDGRRGGGRGRFPRDYPGYEDFELPLTRPGESGGLVQVVSADATVVRPAAIELPVTRQDLQVARGQRDQLLVDRQVDGRHLRVLTSRVPGRLLAVQIARSLESADQALASLRLVLVLLCLAGTAFALAVSGLFARKVLEPVTELTDTAEHISATGALDRRIVAEGHDEVNRMAQRFNAMLDRLQASGEELAASAAAQRQLVADASHELRTPVTSLRTNLEVLLAGGATDELERRRLLADVQGQVEELSLLINDVIELARGDEPLGASLDDVRLDEVVGEAVDRARRDAPGVRFAVHVEPVVVAGAPDRLGRAVANLLANAAGHSTPGDAVEVSLTGGVLEVRDHGPGVPDEEKPFIFDRFYRGSTARRRPGSGLGLAIVRQAAEAHGGSVEVDDAPGGGAVFRLRLPASPAPVAPQPA